MIDLHNLHNDITDYEIRVIGSEEQKCEKRDPSPLRDKGIYCKIEPRRPWWGCIVMAVVFVAVVIALAFIIRWIFFSGEKEETIQYERAPLQAYCEMPALVAMPYTSLTDTVAGGEKLTILQPHNAVAELAIGDSILDEDSPVLVVQAADVRGDNGQIAGAYVINGDMRSRGKAKSGFCAIINGEITIGMAQTTSLLERATEENGFFFRQYPLVYEGEAIENRLKNRSYRKALATLNGEVVVVLSHSRLTLHDFSQALVDLGVKNAIYLIGSTSYMKAKLKDGRAYEFGERETNIYPNTNYIFWR